MSSIFKRHEPWLLYMLIHLLLGIQLSSSLAAGTFSNRTTMPVPCRPDQASALLHLKRSFNITDESVCTLQSWRPGTDCCHWQGVSCGRASGRVTSLHLGQCQLDSAALSPAVFDLTSLRYLNLAWNSSQGSEIPTVGFERLTELTHLNLSSCKFAGGIPHAIGRLTSLASLDLSTKYYLNYLDDSMLLTASWSSKWFLAEPNLGSLVSHLHNLEEIYLGRLDLSGNGANWCSAFANSTSPQLQVLSLPRCSLEGPINCGSLSGIRPLTEINLQYNRINGPVESFADIPSLSVLTLTHNRLEGRLPAKIFQNRNLTDIDIRYNFNVSGSLPNFPLHRSLKKLLVSSTNFTAIIPSSIGNLKSLNRLGLGSSDFPQELPSSIGQLTSLKSLEVSGAGIIGSIPSWIANLTSLILLQFSDCSLSGQIPVGNY